MKKLQLRYYSFALLVLLASHCSVNAQGRVEKSQSNALTREVSRLAAFFDLNPTLQAEIIEECEPALRGEVERLVQEELDMGAGRFGRNRVFELDFKTRYLTENLSRRMLEVVRSNTLQRVPNGNQAEMAAYLADVRKMKELRLELSQEVFLQTLDNAVSLTEQQERELSGFIAAQWQDHWDNGHVGLLEISQLERPSSFFKTDDRSLLSEQQEEFLDQYRIPVTMSEYDKLSKTENAAIEDWDEAFYGLCSNLLQLKRAELPISDLEEGQLATLEIAEKRTARKVTETWKRELEGRGSPNSRVELIQTPILVQCLQQQEWQAAVRKVFGNSVFETIKQDRQMKIDLSARRTRLQVLTDFMELGTGVVLTHRQYERLDDLIVEVVAPPREGRINTVYFYSVFLLTDDDFEEVLKPFQWEMAKDWIRQYRSNYDQVIKMIDQD